MLFKMNGKQYNNIISYRLGKEQLWAEGSGRSYGDGSWSGVILGNFTKPMVQLYFESPQELADFEQELLSGNINVEFYDTRTKTIRQRVFYRNNYQVDLLGYYDEGTQQFFDVIEVNFIPHERD